MIDVKDWGAEPVVASGVGHLVRSRHGDRRAVPSAVIDAEQRFALADLLARKGKTQVEAVRGLLDAGLSPAFPRTVLVVGLFGGVGVSTLAAALADLWFGRGARPVLADASGHVTSGLAERLDGERLVGQPTWQAFSGLSAPNLVEQFAAAHAATDGAVLVAGGTPNAAHVAALAASAAVSWPLVVIDGGNHAPRATDLVHAIRPDLLVVVCRPSVQEIRVASDWLTDVTHAGFDARRHAIGAITGVPMMRSAAVDSARASLWDVAAGAVTVAQAPRLAVRTATVRSKDADGGLRLAAAAVAACRHSQP